MPEPDINVDSFRLVTLGSTQLDVIDSRTSQVRSVGPGKALAIVTYLALAPGRSAARDSLCDLLWGDRNLRSSRPQLRQTIWLIKTQIHPALVTAGKDSVSLTGNLTSDAEEFLSAVQGNHLERALELYSGDFFARFASPGSARFEEWAALERTRFRRLFVSCAESRLRSALDSGRFADAMNLARRVRTVEPEGQTGWRLLLEARMASGDLLGARAEADQFEAWLEQEEWDAEPASREIIQQIRSTANSVPVSDVGGEIVAELVGREREFAAIHNCWSATLSKGARFVHVSGPSGLGKTRLLKDFTSRLRADRARARYVRANYGERLIPFSFAAAIATNLASAPGAGGIAPESARVLISLNPSLSSTFTARDAPIDRLDSRRVGLSLLDLLRSIAEEDPLALCLDDLQWADRESRDAMAVLLSRLGKENVLVLSSSRPQFSVSAMCPACIELKLSSLDLDDVTQLVTSLGRLPAAGWVSDFIHQLEAGTGGNPLHVIETLRYCLDTGLIELEGHEWRCPDPDLLQPALKRSAAAERRYASLSQPEREILLLLGVAGKPIPVGLVASAIELPDESVLSSLAGLEQRGFAATENDAWAPAHDSVAETSLTAFPEDTVRDRHRSLGRAMRLHDDPSWKKLSVQHLATAGDLGEASAAAAPFLRNRPAGVGAEDAIRSLLGSAAAPENVRHILARLPLFVRRPEMRTHLALAMGLLVVIAFASAALLRRESPRAPETVLRVISGQASAPVSVAVIGLNLSTWDPRQALLSGSRNRGHSGKYFSNGIPLGRPGHESWVENVTFPDSGSGEIVLVSPGEKPVRLTFARGDDRPAGFSPDGRYLLFLTTRWGKTGWSDVAILDLISGNTRRLTPGEARFESPAWSPEGTRIAFVHDGGNSGRNVLCSVNFDGSDYACKSLPLSIRIGGLAGWTDANHVLVRLESRPASWWSLVNMRTGVVSRQLFGGYDNLYVDPTGGWILISDRGREGLIASVAPSGQPQSMRRVFADLSFAGRIIFAVPNPVSFIDSVSVDTVAVPLSQGVPHQLDVTGWTPLKRKVKPPVIKWRSLTPTVARVDSLGVVSGVAPGAAVIEASVGGWRSARRELRIQPVSSRVIFDERWTGDVWNRWSRFGDPRSQLIPNGHARVFSINGDDNYFSGAYLEAELPTSDGLALDLEVSTPVNRMQWQTMLASLVHIADEDGLRKWDHRTGYIAPFIDAEHGCSFAFPHGEGPAAIDSIRWLPGLRDAMKDSSYRLEDGKWYNVRVQSFPDGRCGLAINGHAVVISGNFARLQKPMVPVIQGNAVGTTLLVRRAVVRSSVPEGVDWSMLAWNGKEWLRPASPVPTKSND